MSWLLRGLDGALLLCYEPLLDEIRAAVAPISVQCDEMTCVDDRVEYILLPDSAP